MTGLECGGGVLAFALLATGDQEAGREDGSGTWEGLELEDGDDIRTMQELLEHKDVSTTMIYMHVHDTQKGIYFKTYRLSH